jgi:hypothetical protein
VRPPQKVTITGVPGKPAGYTVEVDGKELAGVIAASLSMEARSVPQLTLYLDVLQLEAVGIEAHVEIPDGTMRALIDLGWLPPGHRCRDLPVTDAERRKQARIRGERP